jgi:biopolymer transport protein ExbB
MMVVVFNLWQLILKGGPMMWPIILLSVIALAIGMERFFYLSATERILKGQKVNLLRSLQQDTIKNTLSLCEASPSVLSRILRAAILKFGHSSEIIKTAMEEVFVYEAHQLRERMGILSFIINTSVLIGVLGTVIGLALVFHSVQMRSNVLNSLSVGEMSVGIWQALFSTIAGLMVCILSYSIYSFCNSRINNIIADLRMSMTSTVHVLVQLAELKEPSAEA